MIVTYFLSFEDVTKPIYTEVDVVLRAVKQCKIQDKIDAIRAEPNPKQRRALKNRLPCVLFAGKFKKRNDKDLLEHSGLCVLDWDKLEDVQAKKEDLKKYPFLYAIFVSPSGDGLKAVAKIPKEIEKHRGYYRGLMKVFPELDSTSQNESRICFLSSDHEIYINHDAVDFTDWVEVPKQNIPSSIPAAATDYKLIGRAADMVRRSVDGEKNHVLLRAARLMGGYIASGQVSESEVIRVLEHEISLKNIDDFGAAKTTIRAGIEYGKDVPIEELEREVRYAPKSTGITKPDECWEKMKHSFVYGKKRGTTTYFPNLDNHFTWKLGEITVVIGMANSGKTELVTQLMLLKSIKEGWKWAVFSPENYPEDEFFDSLIHAYVGKTPDPYYNHDQMSMEEYQQAYDFIKRHFFYIYPEEDHTSDEIESRFFYLAETENINGVFIDPFNQLIVDIDKRDDIFLSKFLKDRKRNALKNNWAYIISAHPKSMKKNSSGKYDAPDMYDINNGAMWSNKIDNMISVHRPNYSKDPSDTTVEVHIKKIKKQRLVGIPGVCTLAFNRKQNRYLIDGRSPLEKDFIWYPSGATQNGESKIHQKKMWYDKEKDDEGAPF